jgi:hypothetical protein
MKHLKRLRKNWKTTLPAFFLIVFSIAWLTGEIEFQEYMGVTTFLAGLIGIFAKDSDKDESE